MKKLFLLIVAITFSVFIASQEAPKFGGTLNVGLAADIATLYPWEMTDMETVYVLGNIYEPLVRFKKESAEVEPCLATDWSHSPDYKTWTFHLRKNVKFHSGEPFTADNVIDSIELNKTFPAKVKKIDNYTVSFNLEKPNSAFAITLTMEYFSIASKSTIKCYKEECKKHIADGTGPFKFVSWKPNEEIRLKANENYWGGKPYLSEVKFIPMRNNTFLMESLKNQTIHLTHGIQPNNIEEIRRTPHLMFQSRPALTIAYLGFNTEQPPFNNKNVRIAISYAINKKELVKKYFYGGQAGIEAKSCLPAAMFGYYKDLPEREFNPQKAKALLKEAGYPDGFETTLLPAAVNRPYLPAPAEIAEDIAKYLANIGIKVKINQPKSWKDFLFDADNGNFNMILFGWIADTVDPNDFLTSLLLKSSIGVSNTVRWSNEEFENLVLQARAQSLQDRLETYKKAQLIFYNEMPFIPLFSALQLGAWNEKVKGFILHPASRLYLHQVWLSD